MDVGRVDRDRRKRRGRAWRGRRRASQGFPEAFARTRAEEKKKTLRFRFGEKSRDPCEEEGGGGDGMGKGDGRIEWKMRLMRLCWTLMTKRMRSEKKKRRWS
jgi:hypothetical protein